MLTTDGPLNLGRVPPIRGGPRKDAAVIYGDPRQFLDALRRLKARRQRQEQRTRAAIRRARATLREMRRQDG